MELLLLSGYLASPIFVFLISYFLLHKWPVSNGIWLILSVIRVLFLILLFFESSTGLGHIIGEVGDPRIWKFSLDLALNKSHLGFLFIVDFCFLISNHSIHKSIRHRNSIGFFGALLQALIPIYIICHNILAAAGVLFLSAICMYYFLINANSSKENLEDSNLIQSFFITISRVAILTGVWGFLEFQDSDFILKNIQGTNFGFYLWMVTVVFTIPLPPWSRRLNVLISNLPPNLVIVSMILLSAMAYKNIFSFSQIYTSWSGLEKMIFYGLGLISSIFGVLELFSDKTPHKLPVGMPLFFLSLMLISLGLSQESMAKSAFFLSMLVPASVSFVVCFPSSGTNSVLHKIFYSILFILILGLPGTPIYLVFSSLGSKSIEIGLWTTAIFGLIWFFYFSVNVHFFRTAILSEKDNIKNGSSNEQGKEFLILGILLGLVLIMIGYLTGRLL